MRHLLLATAILAFSASVAVGQFNGGFESGLTSWTNTPAGSATVASTAEAGFPCQGNQYVSLLGSGTDDAPAGYGPHIAGTTPGIGVNQLSKNFTRPNGARCLVSIAWTFRITEFEGTVYNDFFSIDIIDNNSGTLVANMAFADNGLAGGTPFYTNIAGAGSGDITFVRAQQPTAQPHEIAPRGCKVAAIDIGPLTIPGQALSIQISIGNGTDSSGNPRLLVDDFQVRGGSRNVTAALLDVLGSAHDDGFATLDSDATGRNIASKRLHVVPGQRLALRASARSGGLGWALLLGTIANNPTTTPGFGDFALDLGAGIEAAFDGLNPSTVADALLGTLATGANFYNIEVPAFTVGSNIGIQGLMRDPFNPPFFLQSTAATELLVRGDPLIPVGTTDVLDSGGAMLSDDDFGVVSLSALNSGVGFTFFGTSYTQAYMCSNGNITFGTGDTDFSESVIEFFTDQPRIAPLWLDIDNSTTSTMAVFRWRADIDAVTFSWTDASEFGDNQAANNFSAQLFADGTITFYYGSLSATDGLVGISPGGLPAPTDPGPGTNYSSLLGFHNGNSSTVPAGTAMYEIFGDSNDVGDDDNDLITLGRNGPARITFTPNGAGGYRAFAGTR